MPSAAAGDTRAAVERVAGVLAGRSLDAFGPAPPAVREMASGAVRWAPQLDAVLEQMLARPLKDRGGRLRALLWVGLYQLGHMARPAHAVVSEAVDTCAALGLPWAGGLVNALLRRYQRERAALHAALAGDSARLAHPAWLIERLRAAWPRDWEAICTAGNARPPMTLRVHLGRIGRAEYLARLSRAGLAAHAHPQVPSAVVLARARPVSELPGFDAGWVSVQDAAAQLAAPLLAPRPGQRVLDACSAPGGKTAHIAELGGRTLRLLALDRDAGRLARVRENLARAGLGAELRVADAAQPDQWWDGEPFDRILLDAPCTGTGVIRRHPDIKLLRRPEDVAALAARQHRLLAALWPLLAPGGKLVYATCSVLPEEGESQITAFLAARADARAVPPAWPFGRRLAHGVQLLPGTGDMDGFYYACLEKH